MKLTDPEAERSYLADVVTRPGLLDDYPLMPEDLGDPRHTAVLVAAWSLHERGEPTTTVDIRRELEATGQLQRAGGDDGLLQSTRGAALSTRTAHERVKELAEGRRLRERLLRAVAACDERKTRDALGIVHEIADAVRIRGERTIATAHDVVSRAVAHMDLLSETPRPRLVHTGIVTFDHRVGGLESGDLMVIGAQTNVGKSYVALTASLASAKHGHRPGIISLEDPDHQWGSRLIAVGTGIDTVRQRKGQLGAEQRDAVRAVIERSRRVGLELAIATGATVYDVLDTMRSLVRERGCTSVLIDYAQCLYGVDAQSEHVAMKRMATMLKTQALRLGVPLILVSQIKRGDNPDREPTKYDLKEGGDLELKAEYVIMLWRQKDAPERICAKLDKSKVGGNGTTWSWVQGSDGALTEEPPLSWRIVDVPEGRPL